MRVHRATPWRAAKLGDRWQLIAGAQLTTDDLLAEHGSDNFVRSARFARRGNGRRHEASHRRCCSTVALVDPRRVHLERCRAAAAVSEPAGYSTDVDARGNEFGRGVVAQRVQARTAQAELDRKPAVAVAQ
jgi:hypothetical protein